MTNASMPQHHHDPAATPGAEPADGLVSVYEAVLHAGFALTGGADGASGDLVVVSETDLTGNRLGSTTRPKARHSKRRNQVDPLALKAGDLVVHDQHGIGKFVEMIERTVAGARREYLVIEYAPGKRGQPGDKLFVPMESLDQLSRYVGGEMPALSKMGGSDWQNTKRKARKAVREIAADRNLVLLDYWRMKEYRDLRMWEFDRIHMSQPGHLRMAIEVLDVLGVPHALEVPDLGPEPVITPAEDRAIKKRWRREFAYPWISRRVRGISTGDGLPPKYPTLLRPVGVDAGEPEPAGEQS